MLRRLYETLAERKEKARGIGIRDGILTKPESNKKNPGRFKNARGKKRYGFQ